MRVKFINELPTGAGGDLFIPTDTTAMGAGVGPDGKTAYTQNRAVIHLHGGLTPWISDGTPHQWTVPVGETGGPDRGDSTQLVPDMYFVNGAPSPARADAVVLAMLLSTLFEGYRWTLLAAAGSVLALIGLVVAMRARNPSR